MLDCTGRIISQIKAAVNRFLKKIYTFAKIVYSGNLGQHQKGIAMTTDQLMRHYKTEAEAAYRLGYHVNTVKIWIRENRIPPKAQKLIEYFTAGKLKADKPQRKIAAAA